MARLPYLSKTDLAPENQDLLARDRNLLRLLVHSPGAARALAALAKHVRDQSKLPARLRELAILQVACSTGCAHSFHHHVPQALACGVSSDTVKWIGHALEDNERPVFDPLDAAVLQAAREMTMDMRISDGVFAILRDALGHECLLDLITTIAFYNATDRILFTLDVDVEPELDKYAQEYPLPPRQVEPGEVPHG